MLSFDPIAHHFLIDGAPIRISEGDIAAMRSMRWWQKIPFAPSIFSPGNIPCVERSEKLLLDKIGFKGRSVLGIGCYEGFPLYFAESCGASRVVGIKDSFNRSPPIDDARMFTHRLLKSKVEWLDCPVNSLSVEKVGQFDLVLLYDSLHEVIDPASLLYRLAGIAKEGVVVATPILPTTDQHPLLTLLSSWEPAGRERSRVAFNRSWIEGALRLAGLETAMTLAWSNDFITLLASPAVRNPERLRPLSELPDDRGFEQKTAVVLFSCKKYEEAWAPFMTLFHRYWPDCPYRMYFGTDKGEILGLDNISVGTDLGWATNAIKVLDRISEERVLVFQEDFFLQAPVDTVMVRRIVRHAHDFDVGMLRLVPFPGPSGAWLGAEELGTVGPFDDFRFSFQLTLWKRSLYRSLLKEGENPWHTEYEGSRRSILCREPFLAIRDGEKHPIPYLPYAIEGGKWQPSALALFKREGIERSSSSLVVGNSDF